jgi:hypothetical protein
MQRPENGPHNPAAFLAHSHLSHQVNRYQGPTDRSFVPQISDQRQAAIPLTAISWHWHKFLYLLIQNTAAASKQAQLGAPAMVPISIFSRASGWRICCSKFLNEESRRSDCAGVSKLTCPCPVQYLGSVDARLPFYVQVAIAQA